MTDNVGFQSAKLATPSAGIQIETEEQAGGEHRQAVSLPGFGIPATFSKQSAHGLKLSVQKGQLNNLRIRPAILNEHMESSRQIQGVVTTSNIVGQIFKASQDNINSINLALESAAGIEFDDFESYADDAALQAEWIATEANHKALLSTAIKYEGTQAMELDVEGADIVGDEWARTFATTDFSGYTGQFWMYANKEYKDVKMRVFVEDSSANKSSTEIVTVDKNAWYLYVIPVDLLTADGGTAADLTDIVKIGFRVEKEKRDGLVYIDKMVSVPQPGSVILKLWDMGSTMPADGVTSIDDGTQYEKLGDVGITGLQQASVSVDLVGGKRTYHIDKFVAGTALEIPTNELLNIGNYYAITIHYDDTEVNVYGANTSFNNDYYVNGYAFTAPDESTAITKL
ncbi:MAG: hypothetical protein GY752_00770, partial [bacterium]|nr:hypothetical protein [bacterium]